MASASTHHIESIRRSGPPWNALWVVPERQLPSGLHQEACGIGELAHSCGNLAAEALRFARISAIRNFYQARRSLTRRYSRAARTARDSAGRARDQARYIQRESPLRALGVLAGTAFLAGAAIRIWRSRGR